MVVKQNGLGFAYPLMTTTPDTGECTHMFRSGGRYYLWNELEGSIYTIKKPCKLEDIIEQMHRLGEYSLEA